MNLYDIVTAEEKKLTLENVVGSTPQVVPSEAEIKRIIWNTLHIDRPTAKESIEAAIQLLAERPKTRTVQQLMGQLAMLTTRARIKIDPLLNNILSSYNESIEEDNWTVPSSGGNWGMGDAWSSDKHEMVENAKLDEYPMAQSVPADSASAIPGNVEEEKHKKKREIYRKTRNPLTKKAIDRAYVVDPSAKNDTEAMANLLGKQLDDLEQEKERNDQQQKEIDNLKKENEKRT